jgi:hypothetical protein
MNKKKEILSESEIKYEEFIRSLFLTAQNNDAINYASGKITREDIAWSSYRSCCNITAHQFFSKLKRRNNEKRIRVLSEA